MTITAPVAPALRLDLFTAIHKGLRRSLFVTAMELASADFSDASSVARAHAAVDTCFAFLREHADHEDHHVVPRIAALAPALADQLAAEHPRLERAALEVESLWPRLIVLTAPAPWEVKDRVAVCQMLGAELVRRFQALIAGQIHHMDREEREVNALLWAHLSDSEIGALRGAILADISAPRAQEWRDLVGPAVSRAEREAMARAA
jgi:hypothetical protein